MTDKEIIDRIESELARSSYRADQHEENEMVIKTYRVIEIMAEMLSEIEQSAREEERKRILEALPEEKDHVLKDVNISVAGELKGFNSCLKQIKNNI